MHVHSLPVILIERYLHHGYPRFPEHALGIREIGAFDGLKQSRGKQTTQIAGGKSALRDGVREHFAGSVNALRQYQPSMIPRIPLHRNQ